MTDAAPRPLRAAIIGTGGIAHAHAQAIADLAPRIELAAGTAPSVGAEEARRTLEFAAATYASAFGGMPVSAGDIVDPDPFMFRMDGGAVPWPPVKEAL